MLHIMCDKHMIFKEILYYKIYIKFSIKKLFFQRFGLFHYQE
jgi:hypothetical protein